MKRLALCLVLMLAAYGLSRAGDCGNGLPCGPLGWTLPSFPSLPSPTPMPTIQITAVTTATPYPTGQPTPSTAPTGTIMADFSGIANQLATLQAAVGATSVPVLVSGTPVSASTQLAGLGSDAGEFFGYVQGFSAVSLGGWTPFIGLLLLSFVVVVSIKSLAFILPVAAVLLRLILRIVEVVKKLIGL